MRILIWSLKAIVLVLVISTLYWLLKILIRVTIDWAAHKYWHTEQGKPYKNWWQYVVFKTRPGSYDRNYSHPLFEAYIRIRNHFILKKYKVRLKNANKGGGG